MNGVIGTTIIAVVGYAIAIVLAAGLPIVCTQALLNKAPIGTWSHQFWTALLFAVLALGTATLTRWLTRI